MTQEEAATISRQIALIVRQVGDVQVLLPPGNHILNGLLHSAAVLLHQARRKCDDAISGEEGWQRS